VSAWAEANRYVDRGARKGKWSNRTVPFAVEIMDAATDPDIREIIMQKSSQVAGSEIGANIVGYYIDVEPTEIAYVAEKEDKAKAWTIESFDTMVAKTECLAAVVSEDKQDNNQNVKRFPGGQLVILWATSPAELSSRPLQVIIFDEKAAYKPTSEGDAVKLGEARTKTYDGQEKIIKISSPRNSGDDADIEADFLRGDKRQYWVPCPSCDEFQLLEWKNLKWEPDDPDTAAMHCVHCAVELEYDDLQEMLERGRWVKDQDLEKPFWPDHIASPEVASFKISQLYSPFVRWSRMAKDFLEAKKKGPGSLQMQTWVNTALGEPWRPYEKIDYGDLSLNREDYGADCPAGVLVLTAGVDVQKDRLEYCVHGWGRDNESWSIAVGICEGDTGQLGVWDELTDVLTRVYVGEERDLRVQRAFIDSGYNAQMVYRFAKANAGRGWFACKGMGDATKPIVSKASWVGTNPKVRLFPIGTTAAKDEIFSNLQVTEPGPGFCHFPNRDEYDDAFLKQLCSEKKVTRYRLGVETKVYEKLSVNIRNEALDCLVYATAARVHLNPNYEKIAARRLKHAEVVDRDPSEDGMPPEPPENDPPKPPDNVIPMRKKGFNMRSPFKGYKV
jgi:phage terminase large subunit GpA-like protein